MAQTSTTTKLATNWRWWMCVLLFVATTVNYMDRQVLSLTWKDFIAPEFHWTDNDYGTITATFSIIYAICMLFAGKFIGHGSKNKSPNNGQPAADQPEAGAGTVQQEKPQKDSNANHNRQGRMNP